MLGHSTATIERFPTTPASGSAPAGLQVKIGKHRPLYLAGDDADRFFEVESGAVMLYRILDDGRRQLVEVVFPGGICGITRGAAYESCAEALVPTVARSFKRSELARSDALRARVVERLQAQVSAMHDHAVSLGRKTAEERICTLLLRLKEIERADPKPGTAVVLPMSRTEIADYLGLTLETVCRTLTSLSRRKVVELGANRTEVKIPSFERLRQAACCEAAA